MTYPGSSAQMSAYRKVDVETTSQGKLIVLMFNGAIQRAEEAKRRLDAGEDIQSVHKNLVRAQDIIGELRASLDMKTGQIANNLDRIYEYIQYLLIQANMKKDSAPIDEALEHLTSLRDTWHEVFDKLSKEDTGIPKAKINQHGASLVNMQG